MRQYPLCCGNSKCQTTQTPLWRKGWVTSDGKTIMLCNACGLHYKKGHYCMYCNQIYRESDADDHSNPWIGCDRCSRWVHQNCEEQSGHDCKKQKSYLCPDCRSIGSADAPTTPSVTSTFPPSGLAIVIPQIGTQPNASVLTPTVANGLSSLTLNGSSNASRLTNPAKATTPSVIKKRRKTPSGSRDRADSPTPLHLPSHLLTQFSPMTPTSPISPSANFMFAQPSTPTTPTSLFDPNQNAMPCWSQLKSSIQNLPASLPSSPSTPTSKKRKNVSADTIATASSGTKKKSRTTTISSSITTTTTHRVNTAGIDALMGAVIVDQAKTEAIPPLDLNNTMKKGKQTPRKMNADARTAAIVLSTDTPTTPTLFSPQSLFATTTTTTTTTTVVPRVDEIIKSNLSLSEEQFYQYQQLILQQKQNNLNELGDGELSNDSITSVASSTSGGSSASSNNVQPNNLATCENYSVKPVTLLQNTFGSVDKLGNFYGSFNEQQDQQQQQPDVDISSYHGMVDDDEDFMSSPSSTERRPQKRLRRPTPPKVTTTTTLTMTTTQTVSKRIKERMAKNGGAKTVYASSSETEDSDYEHEIDQSISKQWNTAAKALDISLDEAQDVLTSRFPQAPVLKKMGSLWAICEVIRGKVNIVE